MTNNLETNVLIIGKSGVGKSSLLNYIFDKELMETGTGRPVTKKGIYPKKLEIRDGFTVNLSDTWGLEANKAKEWKQLIDDEIKKHDCERIADWFHTIIFCISAKSSRVEDFEKEIIRDLTKDGNKVIVVLTHSDVNNIDNAIDMMAQELIKVGIGKSSLIKVSSVSKKLISGKTTSKFGKEQVLHSIQNNLWGTICNKLPKITNKIIDTSVDNWYRRSHQYVISELKVYNSKSNRKLERIGDHIEYLLDDEMDKLKKELDGKYTEVYGYYTKISEIYNVINKVDKEYFKISGEFNFTLDSLDKFVDSLATIIMGLIPFAGLFLPLIKRDERRDEIISILDRRKEKLLKELKDKNNLQIEEMKKHSVD